MRYGTSGNDTEVITGLLADQAFDAQGGNDTVTGSYLNNTIYGGLGTDSIDGGSGDDILYGDDGANAGADGADTLIGNNGNDSLYGGAGADRLDGGQDNDHLSGGDGNDTLDGGSGNDWLIGGTGDDNVSADDDNDTLDGGDGYDSLTAGNGDDYVFGGLGDDTVNGGSGNDTLNGNEGNDDFQISSAGDTGYDLYFGGTGTDRIVATTYGAVIGLTGTSALDSIEEIWTASAFVTIAGDGNANTLNFTGITLTGISGIDGGDGNDTITGSASSDTIYGGNGNDVLTGGKLAGSRGDNANDRLDGGAGSDIATFAGNLGAYTATAYATYTRYEAASGDFLIDVYADRVDVIDRVTLETDTLVSIEQINFLDQTFYINAPPTLIADADAAANEVSEAVADGASVGYTASAADPEGLPVTYSLTNNAGGRFAINATTGVVTVANAALLDFETATSHTITVRASDGVMSTTTSVVIAIVDGNDRPTTPADADTAANTVAEGAATGTLVGITAAATDPNAGDSVSYMLSNDAGGRFQIDAATGVVTVANGSLIDYEQATSYTIRVRAVDNGSPSLQSGEQIFTITVSNVADAASYTGTSAANSFTAGTADYWTISGLDGNDTLTGNSLADTLTGGTGNDTLNGSGGDDVFRYSGTNEGLDQVSGGAGNDRIEAMADNTVIGLSSLSGVEAITANGFWGVAITGSTGNDTLDFSAVTLTDITSITGGAGQDSIVGTGQNDQIYGNDGNDTLDGGAGNDTYVIDGDVDHVLENVGEGTDTVKVWSNYTLYDNFENLTLMGTAGLTGIGNELNNVMVGNSGDNYLNGGVGIDTMSGGAGNDGYFVYETADVIIENAGEGIDYVEAYDSYTLSANIENLTLVMYGGLNGTGNGLNNVITGNGYGNLLDGGVGADTLAGGTGDDTYVVDNAGDVVVENASEGYDIINASVTYSLALLTAVERLNLTGSAAINATGNVLANVLTGNSGANILDGGAGADQMSGGLGNDTYIVDDVGDYVNETGGQGTDLVQSSISFSFVPLGELENLTLTGTASINATGNGLANVLTGNSGDNILDGGAGADTLIGGAGNDIYVVDSTTDAVSEAANAGTDLVQSSVTFSLLTQANIENVTLTGTASVNATGNALANVLFGNTGNNVLDGAAGADTMTGGTGNDTYVVNDIGDVVTENAGEGTDLIQSSIAYSLAALANFENLTLTGTAAINATGNGQANTLVGNSAGNVLDGGVGADTMTGGAGNDTYVVDDTGDVINEIAGEGVDLVLSAISFSLAALTNVDNVTLTGTANLDVTGNALNNVLTGNSGANVLNGGTGTDTLVGGAGNDTYVVDNAGDVVTENAGEGTDTVQSLVTYSLAAYGQVENLVLTGSSAINATGNGLDNVVTGNSANNSLDGGAGADTLAGGAGDDTYLVDNAGDVVTENASEGTDLVRSSVNFSLLSATNVENLVLTGSALVATGNALANALTGTSAANTLDGGAGIDTMTGGAGNDTYIVDVSSDQIVENTGEGTDTVLASVTYSTAANVENLVLTGTAAINGTGNTLSNSITGNAANNILDGGTNGTDTLAGGAGDDTYMVDTLTDVIVENVGEGTDTVASTITFSIAALANVENMTLTSASNINATGNGANNVLTGSAGNNSLNGGAGADTLVGGAGNDTYMVDNAGDLVVENTGEGTDRVETAITFSIAGFANVENATLTGTAAIDITGNTLGNVLYGNAAANVIDGGVGTDQMIGGAGDDTYYVDDASDTVVENPNEGVDSVVAAVSFSLTSTGANAEKLTLVGAAAVNATGNTLANTLVGNALDNVLDGGTGADTLTGGLGNDTYIVDNAADSIVENAGEGTDTVQSSITYTLAANVENLTLMGTASTWATGNALGNVLTGNSNANQLDGGAGIDTLIGGLGNDTYVVDNISDVIVENTGEGTDLIQSSLTYSLVALPYIENLTLTGPSSINGTGNSLANVVTGNSADNILDGGAGNDTLVGGGGNDTYVVDNASDVVTETLNNGTDLIQSSVTYSLASAAYVENLTLTGSSSINATGNSMANVIVGNSGDNILDGGIGADTMTGGLGNDTYVYDNVGDTFIENASEGTDSVQSGTTFSLASLANIENLTLTGSGAANATGNAQGNVLVGNTGNNVLDGGAGNDTLTGGTGSDTFVLASGMGLDTITDFSATLGDKIQFNAASFGLSAGSVAPYLVLGSAAPDAAHGYFLATSSGISWDADGSGSGAAVQLATFSAAASGLTAANFVLA